MFTVKINKAELERKLKTMAQNAQKPEQALRKFGAYLRKQAMEKAKAQSFAPLAASTIEQRARSGLKKLEKKLYKDLEKARGRTKSNTAGVGLIATLMGTSNLGLTAIESKGVKNRLSVLAAFQQQQGFKLNKAAEGRADLKSLTEKQQTSLGKRTATAVAKAVGAPILGRLPQSLVSEVQGGVLKFGYRTRTKFSEVHNAGGTAGHGARIPKREVVPEELSEHDAQVLEMLLKEQCLKNVEK